MKDEGRRMKDEKGKKLIDLKTRTKAFALRVVRLYSALPRTTVGQVIGKQLLRSGTSVGAHYREGTRSRSDAGESSSELRYEARTLRPGITNPGS
jgi:23S rRNA-intervening sequence protein